MVIELNAWILVNSIIQARDAIFNENRFLSIPKFGNDILIEQNNGKDVLDDQQDDNKVVEVHRVERQRKAKSFGNDYLIYIVEGT